LSFGNVIGIAEVDLQLIRVFNVSLAPLDERPSDGLVDRQLLLLNRLTLLLDRLALFGDGCR